MRRRGILSWRVAVTGAVPKMDAASAWDAARWRKNFTRMALAFGICQAAVTTPVGFATSLLDPRVGQICTGIFMLVALFSSLLIAAPTVTLVGSRTGLVVGMSLSTTYAVLFSIATSQPPGSYSQWLVYLCGSVAMGVGSGILWTAQGTFYADSSAVVARSRHKEKTADVTASLAARFASILLGAEITLKLGVSLSQGSFLQWKLSSALMSLSTTFLGYATLAALMAIATTALAQPPKPHDVGRSEEAVEEVDYIAKLKLTFSLWRSPTIWCLSFTNLTFGFSAGYMNGYVNAAYAAHSQTWGTCGIGTLMATTCAVAAVSANMIGRLSQKMGKGFVIGFGSLMFAAIPLSILLLPPRMENGFWGVWLVLLYVLQGLGRSVYESTNKSLFVDFFPGKQSAGAFANCMMQNNFAMFMSFILQGVLEDKGVLAWLVLTLSALTVPGFLTASAIRKTERQQAEQRLLND